ncbi:hypothetical protein PtA15_12A551 [Puccinia triticina]|uniref:Uncharacterized protein n=1 Tax=Puccinia triticina TaxID=208348 RepID=A0ABY7CZ18_9BASI|nr:uncharacterized protein PtA15_12A551 [Puccinia triticina]WAQ90561.1 hypothetical protein PtA15_12A551 [Puccinia triticina]WAR61874.1 hypothetical protein PtB15_12B566 [Puccinia triticina]
MRSEDESTVGGYCWVFNVSTVFVQTCGLVARIQLQIQEQSVILTYPNSSVDLRLDFPFPSLSEFVKSFKMHKMDSRKHAHIPAVVIVIHFLEIFKSILSPE